MLLVRWRQYVGDPTDPHLMTYLKDKVRYKVRFSPKRPYRGLQSSYKERYNVPNPKVRYELYPNPNPKLRYRYVNVLKKTKDLMLITYVFSTYLGYFSPDPYFQLNRFCGIWVELSYLKFR